MEQRRPVLHAGVAAAVGDRVVDRVLRGGRLARTISRQLSRKRVMLAGSRGISETGRSTSGPSSSGGALGAGVEAAQDALHGPRRTGPGAPGRLAGGEDVDDAAAHGVLARLHHRVGAAVAVGFQEQVVSACLGNRSRRRRTDVRLAPWNTARGGTRCTRALTVVSTMRGAGGRLQQAGQAGDALGHDRRVGGDAVVGQAVPGGEAQHLHARARRRPAPRAGGPCGVVARDVQHASHCARPGGGRAAGRRSPRARRRW